MRGSEHYETSTICRFQRYPTDFLHLEQMNISNEINDYVLKNICSHGYIVISKYLLLVIVPL